MPWGRLDDSLYDHPKLDELGSQRLPGVGLWAVAISWCNRRLTDGFVPTARIRQLGGTIRLAETLVRVGLFDEAEGGYVVHDFLEFNDSRAEAEAKREQRREAGRRGGRSRSGALSDTPSKSSSISLIGSASPRPVPSREEPVPSTPVHEASATDPVVVYANLSRGGYPGQKAIDWLDDLSSVYGDEAVIRALAQAAQRVSTNKVIGEAQNILRAEVRELGKREKEAEAAKISERRLDGMVARRLEFFRFTGEWKPEWGERPAA